MSKSRNLLMSLGAALAATRVARAISNIEFEDVLGTVGLARRRNYALENVALVGLGAIIGAGAALLLAPMSGRETRQKLGEEASRLGEVAKTTIRERKDDVLNSITGNSTETSAHHS